MKEIAYGITEQFDWPPKLLFWGEIRGKGSNMCIDSMGHKESAQFYASLDYIKGRYFLITKNRIVMDLPKPSTVISRAVISSSDWMKLVKLPKISSAFIQTRVEMRLKFIIVGECQTLAMISNLTKQVGLLPGKENAWLGELMINLAQFLFKVSLFNDSESFIFF